METDKRELVIKFAEFNREFWRLWEEAVKWCHRSHYYLNDSNVPFERWDKEVRELLGTSFKDKENKLLNEYIDDSQKNEEKMMTPKSHMKIRSFFFNEIFKEVAKYNGSNI